MYHKGDKIGGILEYNQIIQGDGLTVLKTLPSESVNCCVTSPPYWSLRDYGVEGQLGLEKTFEEYITKLCDIFDEVKRALRKDGTCWVNIGDTYSATRWSNTPSTSFNPKCADVLIEKNTNLQDKCLCLIPQRFAIEMVNRGWILRNTLIWHKPNCMPESAKDRFTVDFEYVFFFSKSNKTLFWTNEKTLECVSKKPKGTKGIEGKDWVWRECPKCQGEGIIEEEACPRCKGLKIIKHSFWRGHDYWFEQQFQDYAPDTLPRRDRGLNVNKWTKGADGQTPHNLSQPRLRKERGYKTKKMSNEIHRQQHHGSDINCGEKGRNRRTVWTIATKSFKGAHFAVFPETLIEPIIEAGCPKYVCKKCGLARVKILEPTEEYKEYLGKGNLKEHHVGQDTKTKFKVKTNAEYYNKGYTDCGCGAGFRKGITLDMFMGAGTTAKVALKQGKSYLGIELKKEYIDMANEGIKKIPETLF